MTTQTEKLDAATIRELLARIDKEPPSKSQDIRRLVSIARYALELSDKVEELHDLAYIGNHDFPDLTWKARCLEANSDLNAIRAQLQSQAAELERLRNIVRRKAKQYHRHAEGQVSIGREVYVICAGAFDELLQEMEK